MLGVRVRVTRPPMTADGSNVPGRQPAHFLQKRRHIDRFGVKIHRPVLHSPHHIFHRGIGADHEDRHRSIPGLNDIEKIDSVAVGHTNIQQDEMEVPTVQCGGGITNARGIFRRVPAGFQEFGQRKAHFQFVVYDENVSSHLRHSVFRRMEQKARSSLTCTVLHIQRLTWRYMHIKTGVLSTRRENHTS
jgi:hypothetical protein